MLQQRLTAARLPCVVLFFGIAFLVEAKAVAKGGAGDFDRDLLAEVNLARTRPQAYAAIVQRCGPIWRDARAVADAVRFLRKQQPLPALLWSEALAQSARAHVLAQGPTGKTGHSSRAGDWQQRIARQMRRPGPMGENLFYGRAEARDVVVGWIVDAGWRSRLHRRVLFEARFALAGVASGPHTRFGRMVAMDFAAATRD